MVWIEEDRCIQIQRQHVVFAFNRYERPGVWSYALRDMLSAGGRADAAQFTGLRGMHTKSGPIHFLAGMVAGKNGYGIGQFGALVRPEIFNAFMERGLYAPSHEKFNVHIPCVLKVAYRDVALWPIRKRPDGSVGPCMSSSELLHLLMCPPCVPEERASALSSPCKQCHARRHSSGGGSRGAEK